MVVSNFWSCVADKEQSLALRGGFVGIFMGIVEMFEPLVTL